MNLGARYRCGGSVGFSPTSQLASIAGTEKTYLESRVENQARLKIAAVYRERVSESTRARIKESARKSCANGANDAASI